MCHSVVCAVCLFVCVWGCTSSWQLCMCHSVVCAVCLFVCVLGVYMGLATVSVLCVYLYVFGGSLTAA